MRFRSAVLVPAAVTALLLAGCTGQNAQPQGGQTPEAVSDEAILVTLGQVDPGLNSPESIDDAKQICADFDNKVGSEEIDEHARELFSDQADSELTVDQARQIVVAISTNYCV